MFQLVRVMKEDENPHIENRKEMKYDRKAFQDPNKAQIYQKKLEDLIKEEQERRKEDMQINNNNE